MPFFPRLISCLFFFVLFASKLDPNALKLASSAEAGKGGSTTRFGNPSGEKTPANASAAPFLPSQVLTQKLQGSQLLFDMDQFSMMEEVRLLQEAAAKTGFSRSDIEALVECELETGHVLDYISAVISNRMN